MPSLSITPGRKFSITTSAWAASFLTISIASGFDRSSVRLRLLPLMACQPGASPRSAHSRLSGVAAHVLPLAPPHLDHVGAQQSELVARIGAGQYLREVENLHALERSGHGDILLMGIVLVVYTVGKR